MRLIRWLVRGVGVIVLLMLVAGVISFIYKPGELPTSEKAEWAIQTFSNDELRVPSRIYLAQDIRYDEDNTPIITNYWTYDGADYKYNKGDKPFPFDLYGGIEVRKR